MVKQNLNYYKVSKVRVYIENKTDLIKLNKLGILTDDYISKDKYLETFLDSKQIIILENSGYNYEILVDDLTKDFLEKNSKLFHKNTLNKKIIILFLVMEVWEAIILIMK
ncbi:MAG: hypothetical protein H6613_03420 [Ignavibacteriales bacterium]|nr:hypothetical protein [Ignavibacteriales bacterium]